MSAPTHDGAATAELLSVALTSSGLENVLSRLNDRINDLEIINKGQKTRLEEMKAKPPEVDISAKVKDHLCETTSLQNLSTKTVDQQISAMADSIVNMGQNVNQFYKDVKYREAVQNATDIGQDELMRMELDRLNRELEIKFTRKDAIEMRKMIAVEMRSMRKELEQEFSEKLTNLHDEVLEHLSRVTDHVRVIQETTAATNELLKYRIEEAFTDIQNSSEDMDAKLRKITDVFGLSTDPDANDAPSFPELLKSITNLQKVTSACQDDIDQQQTITRELTDKLGEIEVSVEEQVGSLTESFKGDFGDGLNKVVSNLEASVEKLEGKIEGDVIGQLGYCTEKLYTLEEQMQESSSSTVAVETAQEKFTEQARLQQENVLFKQQEFQEILEKGLNQRFSRISDDMTLLETRMGETVTTAEASSDKINAVGFTTKKILSQLEDLQRKTANDIPELEAKVSTDMALARESTRKLAGELSKLVVVVHSNRDELDSHVKSSQAFMKLTAEQQAKWSKTCKDLMTDVDAYKTDNGERMTSLERSNVSVVTTTRRLQRSFDALATKERRWDRLEVQTKRHVQVLGGHLAEMEGAVTCAEPFRLDPAAQKHLSAVSQMVAKIIATRADYEVTRQAVSRKNPAEESDWDRKVEALRLSHVNKFVSDVVQVASKLRPLPDRLVEEVRETFANKLDLSMKLAISKYKPIQAGATILGKVQLLPSCMACDRPFTDNPGPGDTRSIVQDHRGERERERSLERGTGSPATGGGRSRSPGQWCKGGGGSAGGSPMPVYQSTSFSADDDGASVTSLASLASKESEMSNSTALRYHRSRNNAGNRDASPHKYVMRSGFKMRQSASEGGGLVAQGRGHECEREFLEEGRMVLGNATSSSLNSLGTSPSGRPDIVEMEGGARTGGGRRRNVEGAPRDKINGSVLDLRPSTMSSQVAPRRDHVTFRDQEGVRGWAGTGDSNDNNRGGVGRGGVVGDGDMLQESPGGGDASTKATPVHLPTLL